jgi:catechol 2,3-dioxygenase-like lactoylglutathione lyase family enzyme
MVAKYCAACHNQRLKTAGLALDQLDPSQAPRDAEIWEKVIRKLRGNLMPPAGLPRPDEAARTAFVEYLENMEATHQFYRDLLCFELTGKPEFSSNPAILDMVGAPAGAKFRQMAGVVPGTNARAEFYEYRGLPRSKFHLRVFDPGAPALVLRVTDLDAMLKRLRAIGTEVLSAHGEPVQFSPTIRNIFVVDPNGVNLELYEDKR